MSDRDSLNPYIVASLTGLILICFFLIHFIESQARDRIRINQLQASMRIFNDIILDDYTNELFKDTIQVINPGYLGTSRPVNIYRARNNDEPQGIIIYPVVAKGYRDEIELGIGISRQGIIYGVRVVIENETPGIGDQVNQDKTDWLMIFSGRSLSDPPREAWRLAADGGEFDQISGATITSRGVINAVKNVLEYYQVSGESLYLK
jgi:electron transport complex protein RnfG